MAGAAAAAVEVDVLRRNDVVRSHCEHSTSASMLASPAAVRVLL
jgi:hypothetical protein